MKENETLRSLKSVLKLGLWGLAFGVGSSTVGTIANSLQKTHIEYVDRVVVPGTIYGNSKTIEFSDDYSRKSYIRLTDIDNDGKWDIGHKVWAGFTPGAYNEEVIYSKNFNDGHTKIKFVEPEFFDKYNIENVIQE